MSNLQEHLVRLQFSSMQLDSLSKDAKKDERILRIRLKKSVQQGSMKDARIYAENVIRKENEARDYLRMASTIDALCSEVQKAISVIEVIQDAVGSATTTTIPLARVDSLILKAAEENGQDIMDQLGAAQSVPSGSISAVVDRSHAEEDTPSRSSLQSSPELAMDSVMRSIQNMTPEQRTEVLNTIHALETQIGMDSSTEPAEHIA